ncbi:MAG TPA: TadE/TadG family type IV pilus assembly protein [Allosphingosinicella sp.]|jgi:Flp pilus assembly protein TadG
MKTLRLFRLAQCLRDDRGTGVIEMAVILPLLAVFVVNIMDLSAIFIQKMSMQKAVNSAIELAMVKNLRDDAEGEPDLSAIKAEAARLAGVDPSYVTTDRWLECDGEEQEEFAGECDPDQVISRYVQVRISNWYYPMFSVSAIGFQGDKFAVYAEGALRIQ